MKVEVRERLDELAAANGGLDVDAVVADMRKKSSPLYALVEWDLKRAHEIYLKDRARQIIREYWVVINSGDQNDEPVRVRKYHSIPVGNDEETGRQLRRYVPIERLRSEAPLMSAALEQALSDLRALQLRYRHLSELAGVMVAIDKTLAIHDTKKTAA